MDGGECRAAYDLGFRDAISGLQRQDGVYGPLCARQGISLDGVRYAQGWQEGRFELDKRLPEGLD